MQEQEHCDGQRAVPGAEDRRERRRSRRSQGGQPCTVQHHYALVRGIKIVL